MESFKLSLEVLFPAERGHLDRKKVGGRYDSPFDGTPMGKLFELQAMVLGEMAS